MKKEIHPQYYENAKASCACGSEFTVGSTKPEIKVEICYKCHPFYTGKEKLIDVVGKVERFKSRLRRAKLGSNMSKAHLRSADPGFAGGSAEAHKSQGELRPAKAPPAKTSAAEKKAPAP